MMARLPKSLSIKSFKKKECTLADCADESPTGSVSVIYLDHNSTTPVLPEVREAMLPFLTSAWGNPSSGYRFGSKLRSSLVGARSQVSNLIGADPDETTFTSGGTESNNAAIHSAMLSRPGKRHIITSQVEHSSVLSYCDYLEKYQGCRITRLPVNRYGLLSLADLGNALSDDTAVVSLMWANNETGVLFPVEEIANLCRSRGVLYHCDAVQAAGKVPISVKTTPFDYLSITGHKIGAPKGIGVLYTHRKSPFVPLLYGGHQEHSRRGGTENVAAIIGFGVAAEQALKGLPSYDAAVRPLRDALEAEILSSISNSVLNGDPVLRLPNTSNVILGGIDNDSTLTFLDQTGICASSGSACMESAISPSHVITAMTGSHDVASESIRFSLSPSNTETDVRTTIQKLHEFVNLVR